MKLSEVFGLSHDQALTKTSSPDPVTLPFRPGSEYRGILPTLPSDEGERYGGESPVGNDDLSLEVLERDRDLVLILKSPNPAWADRVVWVTIDGDSDEVVTAKLTLRRGTDAICSDEVNLGPVAILREKLGHNLRWTVFPPRELPAYPPAGDVSGSDVEKFGENILEPLFPTSQAVQACIFPTSQAVQACKNQFAIATRDDIRDSLCEYVTSIANSFDASAAWLFVLQDRTLRAVFAHKNRHLDESLDLDQRSISTRVAREGVPFVAPYVWADDVPEYKPTLPDTQSAIAVPLMTRHSRIPLGVFHLESTERDHFQPKDVPRLEKAVLGLVPELLKLRALDREDDRWFPWLSFDVSVQFHKICHAIRRSLDTNGTQCVIWTIDHEKKCLFIRGTTGHGKNYISQEILPMKSFNGCLAGIPAGDIGIGRPGKRAEIYHQTPTGVEIREGDYPYIQGEGKKRLRKWRMSLGAPIYARLSGSDVPEGSAPFQFTALMRMVKRSFLRIMR